MISDGIHSTTNHPAGNSCIRTATPPSFITTNQGYLRAHPNHGMIIPEINPEELRAALKSPTPLLVLFHASWSRLSLQSMDGLQAASAFVKPPSPYAPPRPLTCVWINMDDPDGEELALELSVTEPGQLKYYAGCEEEARLSILVGCIRTWRVCYVAALVVLSNLKGDESADVAKDKFEHVLQDPPADWNVMWARLATKGTLSKSIDFERSETSPELESIKEVTYCTCIWIFI